MPTGNRIDRLVIFGAGGDLATRSLLPAIGELARAGQLSEGFRVLAVDRPPFGDAARTELRQRLAGGYSDAPERSRDQVADRLDVTEADVTDVRAVAEALTWANGHPIVAYLALPNVVFGPAIETLAAAALPSGSRVVVEKPFGTSLTSAQELNQVVARCFDESAIFRVDHFLGKRTVLDLLGLRFANRLFDAIWHHEHVERVEIVWDERVTATGRAGYYDRAGALVDMIQNHLLQILSLVAMDEPATITADGIRDTKVALLRDVRSPSGSDVTERTRRARYTSGRLDGEEVTAYPEEPGVDGSRGTETFAEVTLTVEGPRWRDVPFTLRTGKALAIDRREIVVHLRPRTCPPFRGGNAGDATAVRIRLDPDVISVDVLLNGADDPFVLEPATLSAAFPPQPLSAYARVLDAVIDGDLTLSIRGDEVEESWRIIEPIEHAWRNGASPLLEYPAGSTGPS